ncbi:MAG TPA: oligosaccharide flippase family protein, partial [Thermoanaerobaculia bacterium]|nr:oligosaccharide flippase family protein [Thermoanaerobaculia bacterium]
MPRVSPRLARSLAANLLWLAAGDGLVKAGLLAVAVLVGRGLGAAPLGLFTVAVGVVMVTVPLLALGQVEVLIRETAAAPGRARMLLATARAAQRRLLLALALPAAAALLLVPAAPELAATLAAFLPYVVFRVDTITRAAAFKGLDRMDVEARARLLELAGAVAGTALAVAAGAPVWLVGASFSLGAAAAWAWIRHRCRELPPAVGGPGDAPGSPLSPAPVLGRLVAEGLPFFAISVLFQLLLRGDALLLAGFGVDAAEIGLYGAATTMAWGVLALAQIAGLA